MKVFSTILLCALYYLCTVYMFGVYEVITRLLSQSNIYLGSLVYLVIALFFTYVFISCSEIKRHCFFKALTKHEYRLLFKFLFFVFFSNLIYLLLIIFQFDVQLKITSLFQSSLLVFIFNAVLLSIFEEIYTHGFAFIVFSRNIGYYPAQIVFSLFFSLGHLHKIPYSDDKYLMLLGLLSYFLASFVYGYAMFKYQNIAFPIILHCGWNIVSIVFLGIVSDGYVIKGIFTIPDGGTINLYYCYFSAIIAKLILFFLVRNHTRHFACLAKH